ncbi:hypothetical protein JIN85_11520 [Luteolibacter pohnpeiensis]|uniref:Uncharacterized protein n=1 Tax=Luteolibacter pohnpeiensis TaxID=454153 RepID=A0A934S731_9BACT|nr:hypothetical protein [Luteolibacter pohnpeiensis]MBK1883048.1 hypothetical protein [Luteolibacter pohnpeiensis]
MKTKFAQILLFGALAASPVLAGTPPTGKISFSAATIDSETGAQTVQGSKITQTTVDGVVTTTKVTQTIVTQTDGTKEEVAVTVVEVATPDGDGGFTAEIQTTTVVTQKDSGGEVTGGSNSSNTTIDNDYTPPTVPSSGPPPSTGPGAAVSQS